MGRVSGKIAFVTGAASGIGEAVARALAREGAATILADINDTDGPRVARDIGDATFVHHDVSDATHWRNNVDMVIRSFGRLDILVNVAGITRVANIEDEDIEDWRRTFAVNADGAFLACHYAVKAMRKTGSAGSIVIVSSPMAVRASGSMVSYCASKQVGITLTRSVALHCAEAGTGIRCNAILPGTVHTGMLEAFLKQAPDRELALQGAIAMMPIKRLCAADEVASGVLYLASDESKIVTGAVLAADGGYSIA